MIWFADTSFFCSLYREDAHSPHADAFSEHYRGEIILSSLVGFEFRQSIRLQVCQHNADKTTGVSKEDANKVLSFFQRDTQSGVFRLMMPDWPEVHTMAEILSTKHTETEGFRFADILHVATALQLGCGGFLTFDSDQRTLARSKGLDVPGR